MDEYKFPIHLASLTELSSAAMKPFDADSREDLKDWKPEIK